MEKHFIVFFFCSQWFKAEKTNPHKEAKSEPEM